MLSIDFASLSGEEIISLSESKLRSPLADWQRHIWEFVALWMDDGATNIPVFTSGSTGAPQSIVHSKDAMLQSAEMTAATLGLQQGADAFLCLPAGKISGMMMLVRSMANRMNLVCVKPSLHPLQEMTEHPEIDFAAFTPMQFSDIIQDENVWRRAEKIRKVILGGEDIRYGLMERIREMKNEVYATFGMTETISHIALKRLNGSRPDLYYKTLPGIRVSADENYRLMIHAPKLGLENLLTKDMVQIISDTEFEWLGRMDHVINRGGIKIYPEEIEKKLQPFIPHPFFMAELSPGTTDARLALMIEAAELSNAALKQIEEAFSTLDKWSRPREILKCTAFRRTDNGKIKRRETLALCVFTKL